MKTVRIDEIHSWQFGTEMERCEWLNPRVQKELSDLHREIHDKEEKRASRLRPFVSGVRLPSRGTPMLSFSSASCTTRAEALPRTTPRR